ncbi:MAG: cupin domain-containing protein [bacterium]|nr:cupin domain-containing protein [bacterium]
MITAEEIIKKLKLEKHPAEGGYFSETYRSPETIMVKNRGKRSYGTAIYYLLTNEENVFSEMHRVDGDEIFHFYLGDPVEMLHLYPGGKGKKLIFDNFIEADIQPQVIVPAGVWQGARLVPGGKFALMGTTMAPGFEYSDYLSGSRKELIESYPQFKQLITVLTRKP